MFKYFFSVAIIMDIKGILKRSNPAPLWKRVFAYVLDVLIVDFIIVLPFQPLLERIYNKDDFVDIYNFFSSHPENMMVIFLVSVLISLLTILYWAVLEYKLQQSFGKMLMNIYVRSKTKKLTFLQCFTRNISKISLLFLIVDSSYMFFTRTNQRYLEKVSNTEVIENKVGVF